MRMLSASARPTASTARASAAPINLDTCHVYTFNIGSIVNGLFYKEINIY